MKKTLIVIGCLLVVGILVLVRQVAKTNTSDDIPRRNWDHVISSDVQPGVTDMPDYLQRPSGPGEEWRFDAGLYLDKTGIPDIMVVRKTLMTIDPITHDSDFNRRNLSDALTVTLEHRQGWKDDLAYPLDSLLFRVQWAEQFRSAADVEPVNDLLYRSIFTFWMGEVSAHLTALSEKTPHIRHDFKFRYLLTRCKEDGFITPVKVTSGDKFIENIIYGNWGHLINATWNQTGFFQKLLLFLLLCCTLYGGIMIIVKLVSVFTKNIKTNL